MDCPKCKTLMGKDYFHGNAKDKVSLATIWRCEKCGYRKQNQHNIPK